MRVCSFFRKLCAEEGFGGVYDLVIEVLLGIEDNRLEGVVALIAYRAEGIADVRKIDGTLAHSTADEVFTVYIGI